MTKKKQCERCGKDYESVEEGRGYGRCPTCYRAYLDEQRSLFDPVPKGEADDD